MVNVASVGQLPVDLDDPMIAYSFDLADELAGTGVTVNCLHPASLMPTTMVRDAGMGTIDTLEQGLRATLRLVVDPGLAGVTGRYFDGEREARAHAQAYDETFRSHLRKLTESLVA